MSLLEVRNLKKSYGGVAAVADVSFDLPAGQLLALLGPNGAGKSTTMKALMGLLDRKRGNVHFMGSDISKLEPFRIARLGLGFVPENRRIFTDLSVIENLEIGRQPPRAGIPEWNYDKLFRLFPNLGEMPDRLGGRMSGGEQQMLTVARTLMGNPYLVLLDEPSEGVAPVIVEQMANMILELKKEGVAILLSEQNLHFAELVSDRAYVLEKGQIRFQGSIAELADNQEIRKAYLEV
jgi:branched-chain amino acid transport system ATP-binding protein